MLAAVHAALVVIAYRVASTPRMSRPVRRFWQALAFAGLAYTVGDVIQFAVFARSPSSIEAAIGGAPQSLCVLVGTLPLVCIMLGFPIGIRSGPQRWRFWLDAATERPAHQR